jgi:hypothetical protein
MSGPRTRISGSWAKTAVPSGMASTSSGQAHRAQVREELRGEERPSSLPRSVARNARSSSVKRNASSHAMACASPQAMA